MEKKLETMKLQYDLCEVIDCPNDFIGVMDAILEFATDVDEVRNDLNRDKKLNASCRKICKALKGFSDIFGYKNLDYYRNDAIYLEEQVRYVSKYEQCLNRMMGTVDDENYADIYKLALFSHGKFLDNISNVDFKRENLDCRFDGSEPIEVTNGDFDTFMVFFEQTLEKIELTPKVIYEKK